MSRSYRKSAYVKRARSAKTEKHNFHSHVRTSDRMAIKDGVVDPEADIDLKHSRSSIQWDVEKFRDFDNFESYRKHYLEMYAKYEWVPGIKNFDINNADEMLYAQWKKSISK